VSCGALLLASTVVSSAIAKAILIAVALGCADLALGACWAVCLDVGWRSAGVVTGVMNTFGNLGGVIGPLVVGLVVERWRSWTIPFHVAGVVYVIGGVMWLVINPNEPIRPAPPHQTTLRTP
jgi:ACS family glucarate transporter-like MFS transporter